MAAPRETDASNETVATDAGGEPLHYALACPQCFAEGWIGIEKLRHGLRCRQCNCQFLLTPKGETRSLAEMPKKRVKCPRCSKPNSIPSPLVAHKTECVACRMRFIPATVLRKEEKRQALAAASKSAAAKGAAGRLERILGNPSERRMRLIVWGIPLAGALLVAGWFLASYLDDSPETLARRFTAACLADDRDAAFAFMEEDQIQQAEFNRWRTWHFASILDQYRPSGDDVSIEIEPTERSEDTRVFKVTLRSEFIGERTLEQHWSRRGDRWWFDAVATVR